MAKKEGYSRKGFFGTINHYDSNGRKIGESRPSFWGGMNNYDTKGNKIGESRPGFFGDVKHYDSHGNRIGTTRDGFFGGKNHYDENGHKMEHKIGAVPNGLSTFWLYDEELIRECEENNMHLIDEQICKVAEKFEVEPRCLLSHVLEYKLHVTLCDMEFFNVCTAISEKEI